MYKKINQNIGRIFFILSLNPPQTELYIIKSITNDIYLTRFETVFTC